MQGLWLNKKDRLRYFTVAGFLYADIRTKPETFRTFEKSPAAGFAEKQGGFLFSVALVVHRLKQPVQAP